VIAGEVTDNDEWRATTAHIPGSASSGNGELMILSASLAHKTQIVIPRRRRIQ